MRCRPDGPLTGHDGRLAGVRNGIGRPIDEGETAVSGDQPPTPGRVQPPHMALFSPHHTPDDVDRHTAVFDEAVEALVG